MSALLAETGVYQDDDYYRFDGLIDRRTFDKAAGRIGRNDGPALLFDLYHGGAINLYAEDMTGVVADVWSVAEYPEDAIPRDDWIFFFAATPTTGGPCPGLPSRSPCTGVLPANCETACPGPPT